jgi:hypothetical protein
MDTLLIILNLPKNQLLKNQKTMITVYNFAKVIKPNKWKGNFEHY